MLIVGNNLRQRRTNDDILIDNAKSGLKVQLRRRCRDLVAHLKLPLGFGR